MGSTFAGIKAGTLAGIVYIGSIALFNVALLYIFQTQVYTLIARDQAQFCTPVAGPSTISIADCFTSVVAVYVPYIAFLGFFLSLLYSGVFGRLYEHFPGKRPETKGMAAALIVLANLIYFSLIGIPFSVEAEVALAVFSFAMTLLYGFLLGRMYRRYTRWIEFPAQAAGVRIIVDGRDVTGKSRTYAVGSTHSVKAVTEEGVGFRGWATSGGVTLEDSRSFETNIEIEGDGSLKVHTTEGSNR